MNAYKKHSYYYSRCLLLILICSAMQITLYANKVEKLELSSYGFDAAPVIKVYSLDGERWSSPDNNFVTLIKANLRAKCKFEGKGNKAYKGKFLVEGFESTGEILPANHLIPHSNQTRGVFKFTGGSDFDPVKICNDELTKKVALNPDVSLDKKFRKYPFLSKGFNVQYPAGVEALYMLTCNPTGLGFGDYKSKKAKLNTVVDCQGSALAAEKIPKKPVEIKMAKFVPLVSKVSFKPDPATHVGKCPAGVSFKGEITTSRAGEVKYQYVAKDGGKSPVFTMKFNKAGTKATGNWHETVSKPDTKKSFKRAGSNSSGPDVSGWWKLTIVSPQSNMSQTANYKVYCQDQPAQIKLK